MDNRSLEDRIAAELCDVLDEPEVYDDCVLGIHKQTHQIVLANPAGFNKEFETFPITSFLTTNDDGDLDLDLSEISYVASRFE